eukprot:TRINITY_DN10329_c0_g1_i3.p1 TRINITY_DN10329_c0_g1~~TRINITY_DN10329_c0_g1_i3.p1  ORF type:complete len:562 (+),score=121.97 TRINITY_DN10329_c0_g1_i3:178-1863(+)
MTSTISKRPWIYLSSSKMARAACTSPQTPTELPPQPLAEASLSTTATFSDTMIYCLCIRCVSMVSQTMDCQNNKTELFVNGDRMWLARYPNIAPNGTWLWSHAANATNSSGFITDGTAPLSQWTKEADLWLHGYWTYDWSDEYVQVTKVNPDTNYISLGQGATTAKPGGRFIAINALSELDAPGEYYIDREQGVLYFYPLDNQPFEAVLSHQKHIAFGVNVGQVGWSNVSLGYTRGTALWLLGANGVTVDNVTIANVGANATVLYGRNIRVTNNHVYNVACMGIAVVGGNRTDLSPGNNVVDNNYVHDYALWKRTYQSGVFWGGVGNNYTRNTIKHAPHNGILGGGNEETIYGGNNCRFEGNHLEDLAFETDDTGAFYTCGQQGQAWINRGNVIVNNTFKSVRRTEPTTLGFPSVQAVYLDDEMSGWIVTNNTFIDCQKGVFVGGGRKTHVYNNTFYNVDTALHLDNRGMNWQAKSCNNATGDDYLTAEKYRRLPAWQPYNITLDHNCVPVYNTFVDNTCCHCQSITDFTAEQLAEWMSSASNNVEVCNATRYRDESDLTI